MLDLEPFTDMLNAAEKSPQLVRGADAQKFDEIRQECQNKLGDIRKADAQKYAALR